MTGRALCFCILAARLASAADDPDHAAKSALTNALSTGDRQAALRLFDPKMAGYARIRVDIGQLLEAAEVTLDTNTETGVWTLEIKARDLATGVTLRKAKVAMRVEGGMIASFAPADFLAPPHGREAWDTLFAFAAALQNEDAAPRMDQFERAMKGYEPLKAAVTALWNRYRIEPSLDLKSNEGDDTHRTLQVDWVLMLQNPQDTVDAVRREQSAACHIEKQGKAWKIVSFTPEGLFAPPKR